MMAWLVGLLTALAALGLGYAAADGSHSAVVGLRRRGILPLGGRARVRAALGAYRPGRGAAERLDLPPAVQATLAVLRRPSPLLVLPVAGGWLLAHPGPRRPVLPLPGAAGPGRQPVPGLPADVAGAPGRER